jgi:hypothetical protein
MTGPISLGPPVPSAASRRALSCQLPTPRPCRRIWTRSVARSLLAHTPSSSSTALAITAQVLSLFQKTSPFYAYRPTHQSSIPSKTSGNIYVQTSSPSPCSMTTTTSSTRPARPGTSLNVIHLASLQLPHVHGQRSVPKAVGMTRNAPGKPGAFCFAFAIRGRACCVASFRHGCGGVSVTAGRGIMPPAGFRSNGRTS